MFKLDVNKAEEPEVKLWTSVESLKMQVNSRGRSTSASLTSLKPLTTNWKILRDGNTRPPYLAPETSVCKSRSNSWNQTWNNGLIPNWERSSQGCILSPCLFNLHVEHIMRNAGLDEAQAKVKLQYFSHLLGRTDSLYKILMLGKIEGRERRGWQRMIWLDGITDWTELIIHISIECEIRGKKGNKPIFTLYLGLQYIVVFQWLSHVWLSVTPWTQHARLPVLHHLLELAQTHAHWVDDAIQSSHPLLSPSLPAFNLFEHQGLF